MNILVLRLDEIGDFVLTTPFLRELRVAYPHAHITLVVKPQVGNLAQTCPYMDSLLTFNPRKKKGWQRALFALLHLRKKQFDLALLPRFGPDTYGTHTLARWSGAKKVVTHVSDCPHPHEVKKNLHLLQHLGHEAQTSHLELWLTDADRARAQNLLKGHKPPRIALGIGASKPRKKWPHYQALAKELRGSCVVIGGKEDCEAGDKLGALNLAGTLSLRESAAVLEQCTLFIGNDSGPKHIAAAMGTPVIEISCHPLTGSTEFEYHPSRFGAWGPHTHVIQPATAMPPCQEGCRAPSPHCILGVGLQQVVQAATCLIT